jgi:hypothetical protein
MSNILNLFGLASRLLHPVADETKQFLDAGGPGPAAGHAATARDPKRRKQGRIGVRDGAARQHNPSLDDLLGVTDDETIAMAIRGVQNLEERWMTVPPSGTLRLSWPLARDFFAGATGSPGPADDQGQAGTERPVRNSHPTKLPHPMTAPTPG